MARDRDDRDDDRDDDRGRGRGRGRDRDDDRDDREERGRGRGRDRDDRDDDYDDDYDDRPRRGAAEGVPGGTAGFTISLIGLILGTCALLFAFIPCLGIYAMYPGGFAVLLSIIGIVLSKGSKVLGIVAVCVSLAGTGVAYYQWTVLTKAAQELKDDFERRNRQNQNR